MVNLTSQRTWRGRRREGAALRSFRCRRLHVRRSIWTVALAAAAGLGAPGSAQPTDGLSVPPNVPVEVRVNEGAVSISPSATDRLHVRVSGGVEADVATSFDAEGRFRVTVSGTGPTPVHLSIPSGHALDIRTGAGAVRATGLTSPATIRTGGGAVVVETTSYASVETGSGGIRLAMGEVAWSGLLEVTSGGGAVHVTLPERAAYAIEATTGAGQVATPSGRSASPGPRALRTSPAGLPSLRVSTRSGNVYVVESG